MGFFSLNVSDLEAEINKVPFHQQIGLSWTELVPEFQTLLSKKTEDSIEGKLKQEVELDLNHKFMNILSSKSPSVVTEVEVVKERKSNDLSPGTLVTSSSVNTITEVPLEQRKNRRQQRSDKQSKSNDTIETNGNEDLKFIEELEKERQVEELTIEDKAQQSDVVSVKIASRETQNLEDWLDDFPDE